MAASEEEEESKIFTDEVAGKKLSDAAAEFALSLYKAHCLECSGQNVFMSPVSINIALAMVYLGARGNTKEQMKIAMLLQALDDNDLHKTFSELRTCLRSSEKQQFRLHVASRLFGQKSVSFLNEYLEASKTFYGSELSTVDFENNLKQAVEEINSFVAENTNQKIQNIVSEDSVARTAKLILINAIYFKADWKKKFDVSNTKDKKFYVTSKEKVMVPMMYMHKTEVLYGIDKKLRCKALELPYAGYSQSLFILLPDRRLSLSEMIPKLTSQHILTPGAAFRMKIYKANIWLPRFKIDSQFDVSGVLSKLGIEDLFREGVADLSGLGAGGDLLINKILHRAYVDVNEEGTEAASACAYIEWCTNKPKTDFKANHPFVFFIRDNKTQAILFLGKFERPT